MAGQRVHLIRAQVEPGWANAAGHMRASQYVILFEDAIYAFFELTGLGGRDGTTAGAAATAAPFLTEMHVTYRRELGAGAEVDIAIQLLGADEQRLHVILLMQLAGSGEPVASNELDIVNIDLASRQPSPWPEPVRTALEGLLAAQAGLPAPKQAGRGIRRVG